MLEDIARHPGATIGEITARTGLAQSLVSRITRAMADAGALTVGSDPGDRRKARVELSAATQTAILDRAGNSITGALAESTPRLTAVERRELEPHLTRAAELVRCGTEGARSG